MQPVKLMVRFLKLIGAVAVGSTVSAAFFVLYAIAMQSCRGLTGETVLSATIFLWTPFSLFLGSGVTGFLASDQVETLLGCLWIAPGFHFTLGLLGIAIAINGNILNQEVAMSFLP
jgi:hypothetical protein